MTIDPLKNWTEVSRFYLFSAKRLHPYMTPEEYQVYMFIFERTLGYFKYTEAIPLRHFLEGVVDRDGGVVARRVFISKPTLLDALRHLEHKGIIWTQIKYAGATKEYGIIDPDDLRIDHIRAYVEEHQKDDIDRGRVASISHLDKGEGVVRSVPGAGTIRTN